MIHLKSIILLCLTVVNISGTTHHPKVYEDEVEIKNENVRTVRNSESTYRTIHQPPIFNFEAAKQQDYLKFRYAQQQKVNSVTTVNGMAKSLKYLKHPQNVFHKPREAEGNLDDWQPFDPTMNKMSLPGALHLKTTNNIKLYKPGVMKANLIPKYEDTSLFGSNVPKRDNDLLAQGSETAEKRVSANEYKRVIYLHPNQLQEHMKQNSEGVPNVVNSNLGNQQPATQLTELNDLIGKNPNVQLEGLKRLLHNAPSSEYKFPSVQEHEPFQIKEQASILGNIPNPSAKPAIHLNHDDNTITLQTSQPVDKGSLEDIQKQLDEASKIQAQKFLERAQKEAQAHVEAQHKAIALAQVRAQKVALENIQKSLLGDAQALPLVHEQSEEYHALSNNLATAQQEIPLQQTNTDSAPENHNIPVVNIPQTSGELGQYTSDNVLEHGISQIRHPETKPQIFRAPLEHNIPAALYKNLPPQTYGSKELLSYAPNHYHPAVQTNKARIAAGQAQKSFPSVIQQVLRTEQVSSSPTKQIQPIEESEPESSAYQEIILESKEEENTAVEQKDEDDFDDLQYAAKYAFGYRIKDVKEGNDFGHEERRDGKNLEGSYHVLLPDGRLQKVSYYADNSGYHAKVTYEQLNHE